MTLKNHLGAHCKRLASARAAQPWIFKTWKIMENSGTNSDGTFPNPPPKKRIFLI